MSLFESLQKKQSNALAVAQAEIDLLRSTIQEQLLRLESRETLIQTFAATVNSQAIELEILTRDASRERTARAKIEQEMALLIEASLLMLERLFANVDQTVRSGLVRVLDPIRQTIHHLEIPSILQEWDLCEQGVQSIVNDLARSLVLQQEDQEKGLEGNGGGGDGAGLLSSGSTGSLVKVSNSSGNNSNYDNRNPRNSISSTHSAMATHSTISNANNKTIRSHKLQEYPEESMMILNNNFSQQVFVWRKFTADTFLEECVKSVEDLAQERRELQTRIVKLTRVIVEQDEARRLKEIADSREGGSVDGEQEKKSKKEEDDATESVMKVQIEEETVIEKERGEERVEKEKEEEPIENGNDGTTVEVKDTSDVDDKMTRDEVTDPPTAQINLSPDTQFKGSLEGAKEPTTMTVPSSSSSYIVGGDNGLNQKNCSKDHQESPPPLNTIDHQNRTNNTAAETVEEKESHERTRRLESILQKVLEWSGNRLESSKEKEPASSTATTATMDKLDNSEEKSLDDDSILSLGISEAPLKVMRADVSLVKDATLSSNTISNSDPIRNSDVSRPMKDDLENLLQLIRQELTKMASVALSTETSLQKENAVDGSFTSTVASLITVEAEDVIAVAGDPEEPVTAKLPHVEPPTTEPAVIAPAALITITTDTSSDTFANEASCATNTCGNTSGGNSRAQTRPEGITTSSLSLARRTSSSSSAASTPTTSLASASSSSSSSTTSPSSGYLFSSAVQLGSLSTPSSPGLGGIGGPDGQTLLDVEALCRDLAFRSFPSQHQWSKKSKKQPPTWYPSSSSTTALGLPPLPPLSTSSSSSTSQH